MDYTTCMTVIIICLFAMGCLCCVWIFCCGVALMETKYATTLENLAHNATAGCGSPLYQCSCNNTTFSFKETQNTSQNSSIRIKNQDIPSMESQPEFKLSVTPLSISNVDLDGQPVERKQNMIT